ncbi:MAG: hypothetical protein L3J36_08925 [Rhodobacteraceae bacterium]|nr:hypothetical protein [Paracoccaceae bacterium]
MTRQLVDPDWTTGQVPVSTRFDPGLNLRATWAAWARSGQTNPVDIHQLRSLADAGI